jgi:hypothetical protein
LVLPLHTIGGGQKYKMNKQYHLNMKDLHTGNLN